jgi:hypothetical protein
MVWNKFVEVIRVLEIQWDEYVFEYWNQLYVKSVMSVGNSEMLSISDQLSNWKEDCRDDEPGAVVFFFPKPPSFKDTVKATGEQFLSVFPRSSLGVLCMSDTIQFDEYYNKYNT